jgi:hypothetical protein
MAEEMVLQVTKMESALGHAVRTAESEINQIVDKNPSGKGDHPVAAKLRRGVVLIVEKNPKGVGLEALERGNVQIVVRELRRSDLLVVREIARLAILLVEES